MSNTTRMINPAGKEQDVPSELVQAALDRGFSRLPVLKTKVVTHGSHSTISIEPAPKAKK